MPVENLVPMSDEVSVGELFSRLHFWNFGKKLQKVSNKNSLVGDDKNVNDLERLHSSKKMSFACY